MTTVGQRVGIRVGQVVTTAASGHGPITRALSFDGVVQYGRIDYATAPYTAALGVTVVAEVAPDTSANDRRIFTFTPAFGGPGSPAEALQLANIITPYRLRAVYDTRNDGPISQTAYTAPAAADSAGYLLAAGSGSQSGGLIHAICRTAGPAGTAETTATVAEGGAATGGMKVLHIGRYYASSAFYKGLMARLAVFDGILTQAQLAEIYPAEDWSTVRTPLGYWLMQDGADDGANMVIPDLMGGPSATMIGMQRAGLSTTVPTRVAP